MLCWTPRIARNTCTELVFWRPLFCLILLSKLIDLLKIPTKKRFSRFSWFFILFHLSFLRKTRQCIDNYIWPKKLNDDRCFFIGSFRFFLAKMCIKNWEKMWIALKWRSRFCGWPRCDGEFFYFHVNCAFLIATHRIQVGDGKIEVRNGRHRQSWCTPLININIDVSTLLPFQR